jgi:MoaA/NifB/PqqE/SkfB family radical SAM enzyme
VGVRVTVQRTNFAELSAFVRLARALGAQQVSFLAADVSSSHAFGRAGASAADIALRREDLPQLARSLAQLERHHQQDFASGFIAERPHKLRRLLQYYSALCGIGPFPPTRCNAPQFSAVIEADGHVKPCFFIRGPQDAVASAGLDAALNGAPMVQLRAEIRAGGRAECVTCVCSMWREPGSTGTVRFELPATAPRPPRGEALSSAADG